MLERKRVKFGIHLLLDSSHNCNREGKVINDRLQYVVVAKTCGDSLPSSDRAKASFVNECFVPKKNAISLPTTQCA